MVVKDLISLYPANDDGVTSLLGGSLQGVPFAFFSDSTLEQYERMSEAEANTALKIYKQFCDQAKEVDSFLRTARMLRLLDLSIPGPRQVSFIEIITLFKGGFHFKLSIHPPPH